MSTQRDKGQIENLIIYLDNGSSSKRGRHLIEEYLEVFGKARSEDEEIELLSNIEKKILSLMGLEGEGNIYFLPNATYAINEVAHLFTPSKNIIKHDKIKKPIYLSDSEHASNHLVWLKLANKPIIYLPLKDFSNWELPTTPSIFSFSSLSNLEGIHVSIEEINKKFKDTPHTCIVDASQMMQYEIPNLKDSPINYLIFTAHKFFGPNGIGVLYSKKSEVEDVGLNSANYSWMKNNYSMDMDAIEAWWKTLDLVEELFVGGYIKSKMRKLNSYFLDNFPKDNGFLEIINPETKTGIFLLRITHDKLSSHDYSFYLSRREIITRFGLSCAWLLGDKFNSDKIIRISLGPFNTTKELDRFFEVVKNFSPEECF